MTLSPRRRPMVAPGAATGLVCILRSGRRRIDASSATAAGGAALVALTVLTTTGVFDPVDPRFLFRSTGEAAARPLPVPGSSARLARKPDRSEGHPVPIPDRGTTPALPVS